jgi:hypothetical protein
MSVSVSAVDPCQRLGASQDQLVNSFFKYYPRLVSSCHLPPPHTPTQTSLQYTPTHPTHPPSCLTITLSLFSLSTPLVMQKTTSSPSIAACVVTPPHLKDMPVFTLPPAVVPLKSLLIFATCSLSRDVEISPDATSLATTATVHAGCETVRGVTFHFCPACPPTTQAAYLPPPARTQPTVKVHWHCDASIGKWAVVHSHYQLIAAHVCNGRTVHQQICGCCSSHVRILRGAKGDEERAGFGRRCKTVQTEGGANHVLRPAIGISI